LNAEARRRRVFKFFLRKISDDFIAAAVKAKKSGYDGVEIHGAHGYKFIEYMSNWKGFVGLDGE
jgi:2,4-dienoyl-CoA reductase-like NADH-dependent reductase (Old Yellow Enzyme family)